MIAYIFIGIMFGVRILFLAAIGVVTYIMPWSVRWRSKSSVAYDVLKVGLVLLAIWGLGYADDAIWERPSFFLTSGHLPAFVAFAFAGIVIYGVVMIGQEFINLRQRTAIDDAVDVPEILAIGPVDGSPYRANVNRFDQNPTSTLPPGRALYSLLGASPIVLALLGTGLYGLARWRTIWPLLVASGVALCLFSVARSAYAAHSVQAPRYWLIAAVGMMLLAGSITPMVDSTNINIVIFGRSLIVLFALFAALLTITAWRLKAFIRSTLLANSGPEAPIESTSERENGSTTTHEDHS